MELYFTDTVSIIANVPVSRIRLIGYTETLKIHHVNLVDFNSSCTRVVCKNVFDQALDALEIYMQTGKYSRVLSNCLGGDVTVIGSFTSPERIALSTPSPTTWSPTPTPTLLVEHDKSYCATVNCDYLDEYCCFICEHSNVLTS